MSGINKISTKSDVKVKEDRCANLQKMYADGEILSTKAHKEIMQFLTSLLNKYLNNKYRYESCVLQTNFDEDIKEDCYTYVMEKVLGISKNNKSKVKYDPSKGNIASFIHTWTRGYCSTIINKQKRVRKYRGDLIFNIDDILDSDIPSTLMTEGDYGIVDDVVDKELMINNTNEDYNMLGLYAHEVDRDIALLFILSSETTLNFNMLRNLYNTYGDKVFWKFFYAMYPLYKHSVKKFCNLEQSANKVTNRIKYGDSVGLSDKENEYLFYLDKYVKNIFVRDNEIYSVKDILEFLYSNKGDALKSITLYSDTFIENVSENKIKLTEENIYLVKSLNINGYTYDITSVFEHMLNAELNKVASAKQAVNNVIRKLKETYAENNQ